MWDAKKADEELEKLKTFLRDNGLSLLLSPEPDNYIDHHSDTIVVSTSQSSEHLVYTILHELGHYFSELHFEARTKVTTVIEEVLAWDRGYDIAQALRVEIDDTEWNILMEASIRQYMEE